MKLFVTNSLNISLPKYDRNNQILTMTVGRSNTHNDSGKITKVDCPRNLSLFIPSMHGWKGCPSSVQEHCKVQKFKIFIIFSS